MQTCSRSVGTCCFFSLADVVVGLHGAQLYNALFMPAHKSLVEVRPYGFWGVSQRVSHYLLWGRGVQGGPHSVQPLRAVSSELACCESSQVACCLQPLASPPPASVAYTHSMHTHTYTLPPASGLAKDLLLRPTGQS